MASVFKVAKSYDTIVTNVKKAFLFESENKECMIMINTIVMWKVFKGKRIQFDLVFTIDTIVMNVKKTLLKSLTIYQKFSFFFSIKNSTF